MESTPNRRGRLAGLAAWGAVASLALGACAGGDTDVTASPPPGNDEPVTLTVWHYYSADGQAVLDDLAAPFTDRHPNVELEFVFIPVEQLTTRVVTAASAGTGPDVLLFGASGLYDMASSGAILPMDDWWSGYADQDQFSDGVIHRIDGDIYAVAAYVNLIGLWYNEDMLSDWGVDLPTTIPELEAVMDRAVAEGINGITLTGVPGVESQWQGFPWFTSHGFSYGDPQATAMEDTFTMLQDWVAKGYLSAEASTWDQHTSFQHFLAGSAPFSVNGNWQVGAASEVEFANSVAPLPLSANGGVLLGGELQNIGAFSEHPDLAREFVEMTFFSAEGQLLLLENFGTIPARGDAAASPLIGDNPILSGFVAIVQQQGRPSPSPEVPSASVNEVENLVGNYWSRAIARDGDPRGLAADLIAQLLPLLED
ncbi:MAG: hypothetical protein CVT64_03740 [Actinobacteria bacterium HGW-Actinobacteria-4]|nr:MAG: hypothetical protein CVT64_03740 [Actinobacteria bacterium HGW-Actinobacteria-4]